MGDFCEKQLAYAFAPELAYFHGDNVGREPRWAARPLGDEVRIIYLLSYYRDLGPDFSVCETNFAWLIGELDKCSGHAGDSELIVLDVYYNTSTRHWLLNQGIYSQHEGFKAYTRTTKAYPVSLYYPGKLGGYPRSYVARQKHANYASDAECDAGAVLGSDDCSSDSFARVEAGATLTIGSRAYHNQWQDCMESSNPLFAGNGVIECYWTNRRFSGWQGYRPDADPYEPKLAYFGF